MEPKQHRYTANDRSDALPNNARSDERTTSSATVRAPFQGLPAYPSASGPFSTYISRANTNVSNEGGIANQTLPRIIVSRAPVAGNRDSSLTALGRMSSTRSDLVQPPSLGFSLYQPVFSEVLLNAANILESRANGGMINTMASEFGGPASELGQSGGVDSMPVLHSLAEHSRSPEYSLSVKSEESSLKPASSMPCLTPENDSEPIRLPSFIAQVNEEPGELFKSKSLCTAKNNSTDAIDSSDKEELDYSSWVPMDCKPFNMRLVNLNNFPTTQTLYRTNYRSHSTACVRARMGSIQNTAKSLDLMRSLLQKSINREIDVIVQKYIEEYFHPAVDNIRLNNGENAVSEEHMQTVCRQILEEAKKMYSSDARSATPVDGTDMSDAGSQVDTKSSRNSQLLFPGLRKRERRLSSGSESSSHTVRAKKKSRPLLQAHGGSGRSTPSRSTAKSDTVRREGPGWDPERLKLDLQFVMGSKANKALGLGATRGRLYIKHPYIFKYSADQDDKVWLHENHYMPATGGRTYLLIVDDIREVAQTDEYRNSGTLQLDELVGFTVPEWMLEKMKFQMQSMRTDFSRQSKLIYDATTLIGSQTASPANTNTMSPEHDDPDDDKLNTSIASPLNMTGGFSQDASPATFDDNTAMTESFYND